MTMSNMTELEPLNEHMLTVHSLALQQSRDVGNHTELYIINSLVGGGGGGGGRLVGCENTF